MPLKMGQGLEFKHCLKQEQKQSNKLEQLLEHSYDLKLLHKNNEGNNGVILELDLEHFPKRERQKFCKFFGISPTEEEGVAVKMLKVYSASQAEKEFTAQAKAAEVINGNEALKGRVAVPKCYYGGDLNLESESFREKLEELGVDPTAESLGMIMMEYVKGEDLGTFCFKQFIKINFERYKELEGMKPETKVEEADLYLKSKSINQLIGSCHQLLGRKAKYQYFDDSPEAAQERNEISTMILRPLENKGLLKKESVAAIRDAIAAMHENGIYHCDLHPRNIILGENGQTYIIDFGSAKVVEKGKNVDQSEIYQGEGGSMRSKDESLLTYANKLATTPEEDKENKSKLDLSSAIALKNIILGAEGKPAMNEREKRGAAAWLKLQQAAESEKELTQALKSFANQMGEYEMGDSYYNCQITGLMLLMESGKSDQVKNFVDSILSQGTAKPVFMRKLDSLKSVL